MIPRFFTAIIPLALCACAPLIETADGRLLRATSEDFRVYAADVFRRHNAASVDIVDVLDRAAAEPGADVDALLEADERMLEACAPLNRLAIARRDGTEVGMAEMRELAAAVPRCDRATQATEALIAE